MLKILLGPADSGTSALLCSQMVAEAASHPDAAFIAVVPEQSTLMMQRAVVRMHPHHAVMNIDVVSFERLAYRVLEEAGIPKTEILNDMDKILLLRRILASCREDLLVYRSKVRTGGFAAEMRTVITELKQYAIDDNDLFLMQERAQQNGNALLSAKLQDIRLVYRLFQEALEHRFQTQEDLLQRLAALAGSSALIKNSAFYMDGFTGFTPVQFKVLEEILKSGASVTLTVTLPADTDACDFMDGDMFQLSSRTLERLRETGARSASAVQIEKIPGKHHCPEALVYGAGSRIQEIRYIAGQILQGVREEGRRFRDYAVICSNMENYSRIVKQVFTQAGISFFMDYKTELGSNALARMLVCAMDIVTERFSFASVFAFLKCGFTDLPVEDICSLENYCLEFGIRGVRAWREDFIRNRLLRKPKDPAEEPEYAWDLETINRLRKQVYNGLRDFYDACSTGTRTAGTYSYALRMLMQRHHCTERMQEKVKRLSDLGDPSRSKEYEQVPQLLNDILEHLESLLPEEPMSPQEYEDLLTGAMDEIRIRIVPPSLDAVTVGDLTRTRLEQVKVLFLAGVNEGELPAVPAQAGLFTRQERDFLKQEQFDLAPTVLENLYTQHFYLYLLFARPEEKLVFTYSRTSETGEECFPSYILEEAPGILPGLELKKAEEPGGPLWSSEGARSLAEQIRSRMERGEDFAENPEAFIQLLRYFAVQDPKSLQQILSGAFYRNQALSLDEQTVRDLYGDVLRGSVTRFENFYACPFRHFLNYGLKIQERPEYEVKATDVGTIYHDTLEHYALKLKENGLTFRDVSDEDSHRLAREAVEEACLKSGSDVLSSTERNAFLLKRMMQVAEKTTDVLRMQVKDGLYEPDSFEMAFTERVDEHTAFAGRIDRVDLYDAGDLYVKIIDYKSGNKRFSIRDIYTGRALQLTAYLKSAVQDMQKKHPDRHVVPGGVYYYLIQDHFVHNDKEAWEKFRMSGLTSCEPDALKAIDTSIHAGESSRIVEISYGKSGLHSRSRVANTGEFQHLMDFTEQKIRDAGERIRSGEAGIEPVYDSSSSYACMYCEYRDVCKFEAGKWGSDYRKLPDTLTTADMEKEIYGRDSVD